MTNVPHPWQDWDSFVARVGTRVQGAARTCNGAFEMCYQHPWGAKSHALAIAAMPALIGDLSVMMVWPTTAIW